MILFWGKLLNYFYIIFFLFCSFIMSSAYSENITEANTVNSDNTTQKKFNADGTSLTITNSATLSLGAQQTVHINSKNNGIVTIESGSSITSTASNAIQGKTQSGLIVTNSGTISAGSSKAINLLNAQNTTITNNSGGVIKSNTNTITFTENSGTGNIVTINNSGEIYAEAVSSGTTSNNAIKSENDTDNVTIINNSGGHIHNNNSANTVLR